MIKDPPLLKVRKEFPRPSAKLLAAFTGAMTGHVVDAMDGGGALDSAIRPLGEKPFSLCGVALTCDAGPSDNLALFGALHVAKPGDILIAATGSYRHAALTGDLLAAMARNCGVQGLVTDGVVRDAKGILATGLAVYCTGLSPNSPARQGPGTVGLPIVIGGINVSSGDIVVADEDGVVVIPLSRAEEVASKLQTVREAEADLEAKVKAGLRLPSFITDIMQSSKIEYI